MFILNNWDHKLLFPFEHSPKILTNLVLNHHEIYIYSLIHVPFQTQTETRVIQRHTVRRFSEEFQQLSIQSGILVPWDDCVELLEMKRNERNDLKKRVPGHTLTIQNHGKTIPPIYQPAGIQENSNIMKLFE